MTPPSPYASHPEDLTTAKAKFLEAAYSSSPLRFVEKSPWVAVCATAATTMAVTVITGGSFFGKVGGGLVTQGLGLAAAFARSKINSAAVTPSPAPTPAASGAAF